jgi:homoserine kinase
LTTSKKEASRTALSAAEFLGAGPSIFMFSETRDAAEAIGNEMTRIYRDTAIEFQRVRF